MGETAIGADFSILKNNCTKLDDVWDNVKKEAFR